jgi:D-alanine-D-alanine ligase
MNPVQSPMKVAIVMGGASPEHEVSLASGRGIARAVEVLGHTAIPLVIDADGNWVDGQHEAIELLQACDVTVPALHGEDGILQGFLQQLKIPYVGSGVAASAVGLNNNLTKAILKAHDIPVTLKSPDPTDSEPAMQTIKAAVLEFPDGRVEAAPALEIHGDAAEPVFTTAATYDSIATQIVVPAPLDPALAERFRRTAIEVFEVLGCAGLARVDFFVPADGDPVVNEINTFPGFTPASQCPRMWAAAGMSYAEVIDTLLRTAQARARG